MTELDEHNAWVQRRAPNDLGDGKHRWGPPMDGYPATDFMWVHPCQDGRLQFARIDVTSGRFHTLVSRDPLHVEPSILCPVCGDHGFIREGRWVPA